MAFYNEEHQTIAHGRGLVEDARYFSALECLNAYPRLVLLGAPGSGKSTFVNFVALCLCGDALNKTEANIKLLTTPLPADRLSRKDEKPQEQKWDYGALLPVRVVLRDFAARGLPPHGETATAEHLWNFIAGELGANAEFAAHLKDELRDLGGILLLDGLDEVSEAAQRRTQIKQSIEDFAITFYRCRILVTSRTYAYQKQDWRLDSFTEAELAPFTLNQINNFIERWYTHIAPLRAIDANEAKSRAEQLKRTVAERERLRELAERPLLLTLMASLHAWRGGSLPEKREELYSDAVNLLLDIWERPKKAGEEPQPSLAEWLRVDREKVRGLLNELAYKAHAAQKEDSGTADISQEALVNGLIKLANNPDVKPARLIEYLSDRAGLLIPHGVGVFTFPHRTFQEYLAACYLTDNEYPDRVAELAREDINRWREVTLLAGAKAGRGSLSAIWELADALCARSVSEVRGSSLAMVAAHLAGQLLAESADLTRLRERDKPKLRRVQDWLTHILENGALPAQERALSGDSLATLGDPRFDPDHWGLPEEPLWGFVEIPEGEFIMGTRKEDIPNLIKQYGGDEDYYNREVPQHKLTLPRYFIARYPTTVAQFKAFVEASGHKPENADSLRDPLNRPVRFITWHEAIKYCDWLTDQLKNAPGTPEPLATLSRKEKWRITLPDEAQWEKASRGADGRAFPWSGDFDKENANTGDTGIGTTSAAGAFPNGASPYGLLDTSGNVWEWTRSLWGEDWQKPSFKYPYDPKDKKREDLKASDEMLRVLRGGAFDSGSGVARCAYRLRHNPSYRYGRCGFRVVASPVS